MHGIEVNLSDEEALQNFLLDIDCLDELLPWTKRFNLFDVLKISRMEIRHSNMLAWLLNPNENHGLGDAFLKAIVQIVVQNDDNGRYNVLETLLIDFYSFVVYREWKNIDILLVSDAEKFLIAIENKIDSHEHDDQLKKYRDTLATDYPNYRKMHLYLTPEGEEPSDADCWDALSYRDVVEALSDLREATELAPDVALVVENYLDVLRRDIVEDEKLIEICNKIYAKHKKALDLIFEHRIDGRTRLVDIVKTVLETLSQENVIITVPSSNASFLAFHTSAMNECLPPLKEANGSWGSEYVYTYWLAVQEERMCGIFEIGGWNVPEDEMQIMQRMIDIEKPNDKRRNAFRYKRLFRTGWHQIEESDSFEEAVADCTRNVVDKLLRKESKLLKRLQEGAYAEEQASI